MYHIIISEIQSVLRFCPQKALFLSIQAIQQQRSGMFEMFGAAQMFQEEGIMGFL